MIYSLCNCVFYDGCEAFVSKFILPTEDGKVTKNGTNDLLRYADGNGELIKIDVLYPVSLDNIIAFKNNEVNEYKCAFDRFDCMYFR